MASETLPSGRAAPMTDHEGTHAELLVLLAAAHEAVGHAHKFVREKRPKLDGSGVFHTPVAWRKFKSGAWAFSVHHPEKVELARRHGWEALYIAPEPD